ncbi:MAG: DNA gyrase inhibitor YacG [Pseudomonadota bacterium]
MKNDACPVCGRPVDPVLKPFCSKRCADIDLHRWLNGSYAIPSEEDDSDGAAEEGGYGAD